MPKSVRNDDYDDREILGVIARVLDDDGYASTTEIALALGFSTNGGKSKTPASKVASRLSWMRAGKLLESVRPNLERPSTEPGARDLRWRPSQIGLEILEASLGKATEGALERMGPGAQVLAMRHVMLRAYVEGDVATAFATRRQYQHLQSQRQLKLR